MTDILLDVEEVLADTHGQFCKMHNDLHQTNYSKQDITSWEWVETEVDYDEFMQLVERAWRENLVEPLESDLDESVGRLVNKYNVDVITARKGVEDEMVKWLHENGIDGYRKFESVKPSKPKSVFGHPVIIDDNPTLVSELDSHQVQYLIENPWNESRWDSPQVKTEVDLKTVVERLC